MGTELGQSCEEILNGFSLLEDLTAAVVATDLHYNGPFGLPRTYPYGWWTVWTEGALCREVAEGLQLGTYLSDIDNYQFMEPCPTEM